MFEKEAKEEVYYPRNQQFLFNLLEDYKKEYRSAKNKEDKFAIQNKYAKKIGFFLADSLVRFIDTMYVTVDTVFQENWLVTTQFHSGDVGFKYGMIFKESMDSQNDSLYHWMRSLQPHSKLMVSFELIGGSELNYPDDNSKKLLFLKALPLPLWNRPK